MPSHIVIQPVDAFWLHAGRLLRTVPGHSNGAVPYQYLKYSLPKGSSNLIPPSTSYLFTPSFCTVELPSGALP